MNIKLIDCTFRDGGYYNHWDFEEELIKEIQHLVIDTGRTEADLVNEALMLLVRSYKNKKSKK